MADLFDDEPKPNSPEDIGGFVPRAERGPKPWETSHPDHPAQRSHNKLQPGEDAPASWNVANIEMGIAEMRTFLGWCDDHKIDTTGHTVGSLYVALNAHGKQSFRWLCQQLVNSKATSLPAVGNISKAIKARQPGLLYAADEPERRA